MPKLMAIAVAEPTTAPTLHETFLEVERDLNTVLVERESAVHNALIALLTGEHYLQLGPPGIGKSLLMDALHARIAEARTFKILLAPTTTPDELFGPVDLVALADDGRYTRRRAGSLTTVHFALIDEVN